MTCKVPSWHIRRHCQVGQQIYRKEDGELPDSSNRLYPNHYVRESSDQAFIVFKFINGFGGTVGRVIVDNDQVEFEICFLAEY